MILEIILNILSNKTIKNLLPMSFNLQIVSVVAISETLIMIRLFSTLVFQLQLQFLSNTIRLVCMDEHAEPRKLRIALLLNYPASLNPTILQ